MHEQLIPHKHPTCVQEIINLKTCHSESGVWQMFGICNSAKDALNVCFKRERNERRRINNEDGRARKERWQALMAEMEEEDRAKPSEPTVATAESRAS